MKARRESGLTLIEVMVAVAVIGIAAAVTVPSVLSWLPDYRVKRAARELYSNLQWAKMTAVREGDECTVAFESGPDQYTVNPGGKTVVLAAYGSGVKFDGPSGETYPEEGIAFNPRGLCTQVGYAYLTNDRETVYFRVGPPTAGRIRMDRYNPHAAPGNEWN